MSNPAPVVALSPVMPGSCSRLDFEIVDLDSSEGRFITTLGNAHQRLVKSYLRQNDNIDVVRKVLLRLAIWRLTSLSHRQTRAS